MHKDLFQIEFYFPPGEFTCKNEMADSIISSMKENGSIEYSGYTDVNMLRQGLLNHLGNGDTGKYRPLHEETKKEIHEIISETIEKYDAKLSVPTKNFIFIHPYFPTEEDAVFEGVMAVAVYSCVFHIFINVDRYTKKSLENTVAHELNHTIYYYHHYDDFNNYTLLDEILLEGLAENFREQYFDPNITLWAGALKREDALEILKGADHELLDSRDKDTIKEFLFGSNVYRKWTGYSVGYWLVKEFIDKNRDMSWNELMKSDRNKFLKV